ncbi:hypothetical protein FJT64_025859 [Amphibalanus amphitrite]|uniref:Uncharacterized protein n=1 Tax=Amphibalanus amphitrite TaxID=1232801 RepID=A0A6A4WEG3_AMPAM|nr:hypothetical protein FJT64_025859 [Amphibalanus amphitrite]
MSGVDAVQREFLAQVYSAANSCRGTPASGGSRGRRIRRSSSTPCLAGCWKPVRSPEPTIAYQSRHDSDTDTNCLSVAGPKQARSFIMTVGW